MGDVMPLLGIVLHMFPFREGKVQEGDDHAERNGLFLPIGFSYYCNTRYQNICNGQVKNRCTIPLLHGVPRRRVSPLIIE